MISLPPSLPPSLSPSVSVSVSVSVSLSQSCLIVCPTPDPATPFSLSLWLCFCLLFCPFVRLLTLFPINVFLFFYSLSLYQGAVKVLVAVLMVASCKSVSARSNCYTYYDHAAKYNLDHVAPSYPWYVTACALFRFHHSQNNYAGRGE